jgi:oligoendopeptidase F
MFDTLPTAAPVFLEWDWPTLKRYYDDLAERPLTAETLQSWLEDWSSLSRVLYEMQARLAVATTVNTADEEANRLYRRYLDEISPPAQAAEQTLRVKLLASGLQPEGFEVPMRRMRAEAALFRAENVPLLAEEEKLTTEYDRITGAWTVEWEGRILTLRQLSHVYQATDRSRRERAWRLEAARRMQDRERLSALWGRCLTLRRRIAANAGMKDYREYRWRQLMRFDYTPDDALEFHRAIESEVVPAVTARLERRRRALGVDVLRPWDLEVDAHGRPPLRPFDQVADLEARVAAMFDRVDPVLGEHFQTMRREQMLDLANREHKAPGGYMDGFPVTRRPFIFMNAVGLQGDVQTMLHEGGHAFHFFEAAQQPYFALQHAPMEFNEVASMAMEFLGAPYLAERDGGFYSEADAARARAHHLEEVLHLWPYVAAGDAFQHWIYTHPEEAAIPERIDAEYLRLWRRFMPVVDWSGLEDVLACRWQRVPHFFRHPFYYLEYGIAQLGAVQVWGNALRDQGVAVKRYRSALALGGSVPLPELFAAAGAKFALDRETLRGAVTLLVRELEELDTV